MALGNLTAIIGPSGNGKSTLADAFGFLADCLEIGLKPPVIQKIEVVFNKFDHRELKKQ